MGLVVLAAAFALPLQAGEGVRVEPDVVYGRRDGMALTFDVIRPAKPNGAGVLLIQSGGWYSTWVDPKVWPTNAKHFLDKGVTVFVVRHASAPKYTVPEAIEDVRRSVRFIHLKAKEFGVAPTRLGAVGSSAGGHLALMLATTGDDGDPAAKDEVLRQSSRIAAAVALFPPTDLRGWVTDPPDAIKKVPALKPPLTFDVKKEPASSPLLHVSAKTAPSLMIHGDKDELVPIDHSRKMLAALQKVGATCKLVVVEGAGHGYSQKQNQEIVIPAMLAWFDKYLGGEGAAMNDAEKLQGTWLTVSQVADGKTLVDEKTPPKAGPAVKLAYEGDKWMVKVGDKTVAWGKFKIDQTKTPKEIDILDETGTKNDKTKLGIYEFDGDTYRYCLAPAGKPRPTEFTSKAGSGNGLMVSKREKS